MKHIRTGWAVFAVLLALSLGSLAEARIGGGRSSFGSRGSRGFGSSRSYSTPPSQQRQPSPNQFNQNPSSPLNGSPMGGSFTRNLVGGIAGGFLGSMLFRQMGFAGSGMPGQTGGGFGFLEILLLAGLGYFIFRHFANRRLANANGATSPYEKLRSVENGPYAPADSNNEETNASRLRTYDSAFDLATFKETRMDDFMRLQSAWNYRDLSSVSAMVAPEILGELNTDISRLKNDRQINHIENIAVRGVQLVDAWQEYGKEFATLRFRANVVDYTVDETTGSVVTGDRVQPVKFEENWTFVRDMNSELSSGLWKLSAIES